VRHPGHRYWALHVQIPRDQMVGIHAQMR
jgi:hypothetical protein